MQPGFVTLGTLYKTPGTPGVPDWRQPGGPGTIVLPQAPTIYPPRYEGYPQSPFAYEGLYSWGCGHWGNSPEVFTEYDPYLELQAAIICCPVCSYIQLIVEPAIDWWESWYGQYSTGLSIATLPTVELA